MQRDARRAGILATLLVGALAGPGSAQLFRPDTTLQVSSLSGWTQIGDADWRVENGEIVGRARQGGNGGWLVLDRGFQDVGFYTQVHCASGCRTGVALRLEKTAAGMRAVYVSLTEGDLATYRVTLDPQGRELTREKPAPLVLTAGNVSGYPSQVQAPAGSNAPVLDAPRMGVYRPRDWNGVSILLARMATTDNNGRESDNGTMVRPSLDGGGGVGAGIAGGMLPDAGTANFGPIALYAGGTGEVRFRRIAYTDLNARHTFPKEETGARFRVQRLSEWPMSFAASVADFNRDGHMDVVAGSLYWLGPDFSVAREMYPFQTYNPTEQYPVPAMYNFAGDFTGDGWPDVLGMRGTAGSGVGTLYVNPRGEPRRWDRVEVLPSVGNEVTVMKDVDGDGVAEVVHAFQNRYLAYSKPDPTGATKPWITTVVTEPGPWGTDQRHGLGVGDVNGDGRADILSSYGWWEQPSAGSGQRTWTYHPQAFGRRPMLTGAPGGGEIAVYDANGDGLNDVVTTLEAHGMGLAWFEQKRDAAGRISFVQHMIMDDFSTTNAGGVTFTQPHGGAAADIDGDGQMDFITGKSLMHHFGYSDVDPFGPAVMYWYKAVRDPGAPGGARFVPELIHNRSGIGDKVEIADVDRNGTPDIVLSSFTGTYILFNDYPARTAVTRP